MRVLRVWVRPSFAPTFSGAFRGRGGHLIAAVKVWIETRRVRQPTGTVTGAFGCSVMFVAYFKWLDEWRWLQPGGIEERIPEPEKLFLDADYVENNLLAVPRGRREKPGRIRRQKGAEQLHFSLGE